MISNVGKIPDKRLKMNLLGIRTGNHKDLKREIFKSLKSTALACQERTG